MNNYIKAFLLTTILIILGFGCQFPRIVPYSFRTRYRIIEAGGEPYCLSRHNQYTNIYYSIDPLFTNRERDLIEASLRRYMVAGITFIETGSHGSRVHVSRWRNNQPQSSVIGCYVDGTRTVLIDADKILSDNQFIGTVIHEIGHWLGMNHVCTIRGEASFCSAAGYGPAIMNPYISREHITELSPLDLRELNLSAYCVQ